MHEDLQGLQSLMAGVAPGGKELLDPKGVALPNPVASDGSESEDELRVCISMVTTAGTSTASEGDAKCKKKSAGFSAFKAQQKKAQELREGALDV